MPVPTPAVHVCKYASPRRRRLEQHSASIHSHPQRTKRNAHRNIPTATSKLPIAAIKRAVCTPTATTLPPKFESSGIFHRACVCNETAHDTSQPMTWGAAIADLPPSPLSPVCNKCTYAAGLIPLACMHACMRKHTRMLNQFQMHHAMPTSEKRRCTCPRLPPSPQA